jgi:hypothetical protein
MKNMYLPLLSSALLIGCQPELDDPEKNVEIPEGSTHRVCAYNDNDELSPQTALNEAEDWLFIESLSEAPLAINIEALPEDDQFTAAFALTAFIGPGLTDAFAALNALYVCTEDVYELNQCNWEMDTDSTLKVVTTFGAGQNYTATVTADEGDGFQTRLTIDGKVGDLGNLTMSFYEAGVLTVTRTTTRTTNGTETVVYRSDETNWTATETSDCSGSLTYSSTEDAETVTVDANWQYSAANMTGSLEFFQTGMGSTFELNW